MSSFTLREIIEHAREHSPFYAELYRDIAVPSSDLRLEQLPIVDQSSFWAANSMDGNRLLTGPISGGVVYKSGGTTGSPKFSVFNKSEWETFCTAFGRGMDHGGLRDGDRVANLFYAGDLYASFLFITKSLERASANATNFPLTGGCAPEVVAKTVEDFKINTLAGVPTTVLAFAQYVLAKGLKFPAVRRVLFGGESMYPDQRAIVARAFPGVIVSSIGYASVDAGLLGFADESCGPEEHRVFADETIIELVDEDTGAVITEPSRPGKVILTNLTRKLMPVIRYPAGDRAVWAEPAGSPHRKFALLGRSEEAARIGPVSLYFDDVRQVIAELPSPAGVGGFQMVLTREEGCDCLTIRIAVADPRSATIEDARDLERRLFLARPLLELVIKSGKALPLRIEWLRSSELAINLRTGKLKRMVDNRR